METIAGSLLALVAALPWAFVETWPGLSLGLLGVSLIVVLAVDFKLWWLKLRVPLSLWFGMLTLAIGYVGSLMRTGIRLPICAP